MTIAAIIGAGDLGGAVAQALAARQSVNRVVIVDAAEAAARGKALDILQSGAILGADTRLEGTADVAHTAAACSAAMESAAGAICIVADRFGHPSSEWRGDEGVRLLMELSRHLGRTPILFAGTEQTGLMVDAWRDVEVRPARLIGSAPEAFAAAVRAIVALEARCGTREVTLSVLGTPPDFVIPWSEATIGGYAIAQVLTPPQISRLDARARRLWPLQPYALATAAAVVAEGVLTSDRRAFNVLAVLEGEFGVRGRAGTVPSVLSTTGIVHRRVPSLTTRERVQLETALGAFSR